ncbi:hypothetical protein IWQ60_000358 [Tieghemiomyces parasiticus]|uniref:Phosphoglucomutase n=1 Tax=Tieghemiomyces parasiticus TaxID=78921 RepID=A0A9W8AIL5_9FUNG|nr:hypothetical protein IWQ60_000358 [Tieghemiomyces parasiticus]
MSDPAVETVPIQALVERWLALDKDEATRAEIAQLAVQKDYAELEARLRHPIQFGTAGLRARMTAGFSRMNNLTVTQASQGLCRYALDTVPGAADLGVVIGHDHRHHSQAFAECAATAFLNQGFKVYYHNALVHTPLVPYAVRHFGATCGVMVTASHNPKDDNGYKVYWSNACQIISPHDRGIAQAIANNQTPWQDQPLTAQELAAHPRCEFITDVVADAYFAQVKTLICSTESPATPHGLRFVYTPMHGVGLPYAERAFEAFGLAPFTVVPEQAHPDPDFPTVKFPNPEEKGALDLAVALATREGIPVVLANDPDADRFAVAEAQPAGSEPGWQTFTGDQIGILLAHHLIRKAKAAGDARPLAVLNSTVSSRMLPALAAKEGVHYEETLTGFKWLGNRALDLESKGYNALFAYEEALDKDGVTAMVLMAELCGELYGQGTTLSAHLESLYHTYGQFVSGNGYYFCNDPDAIREAFRAIRYGPSHPQSAGADRFSFSRGQGQTLRYPKALGTAQVTYIRDLTVGFECHRPAEVTSLAGVDTTPHLPTSASSEMISFAFDNGCTLTLRTSGTEPKVKYYLEGSGSDRKQVEAHVQEIAHLLPVELLRLPSQ